VRIVVAAVGTRGDFEPHLALAQGLRAAGYQVRLTAPLDFQQQAEESVEFHPIQVSFRTLYDTPAARDLLASGKSIQFLVKLQRIAVPIARRIIDDIDAACQDADAACFSPLAFPAFYSARDLGIPCFPTHLQPLGRTWTYPSPVFPLGARTPGLVNRLTYFLQEQVFWQLFRPLMKAKRKITLGGYFADLYGSGRPAFFAYSPALAPKPRDWLASMHVTGYWRLPPDPSWTPPAHVAEFLGRGDPPVCIGFGSMRDPRIAGILPIALEALRAMGLRAMVLSGWSGVSPHASNVCVAESIPHDWLFSRVAAVVSHGGAGTTAAALRAGVPSLILPFFFDQTFWGRWLAEKRLGPYPISSRRLTVDTLRKALERALGDRAMRARLGEMRERIAAEDGLRKAVEVLSRFFDRGGFSRRKSAPAAASQTT
jgi:sterol 3beta-glucosyltransferase